MELSPPRTSFFLRAANSLFYHLLILSPVIEALLLLCDYVFGLMLTLFEPGYRVKRVTAQ